MKATFVSIWKNIKVESDCEYNPEIFNVTNIENAKIFEGNNDCTREYIILPDGTEIERKDFTIDLDTDKKSSKLVKLEDAAYNYSKSKSENRYESNFDAFVAGAKWQKEQDEEIIRSLKIVIEIYKDQLGV